MENATKLQKILTQAGFKTLAAGGFVRDTLLGRVPKDIDLATKATPDEMILVFKENNIKYIETGLKHGTLTAIIEGEPYEVTSLRIDKVCHGREAEVAFVKSFEEDAKRRDLTINALFMDLECGTIYDYVGGQEDLASKTLRFVGDPNLRVSEDYLRILRLFRFKCQLGFDIAPYHKTVAVSRLPYLAFISPERIADELKKMVIGEFVEDTFRDNPEMVTSMVPELVPSVGQSQNHPYHYLGVYEHTVAGLDYLKFHKDPILSIAHLLHDVAKPFTETLGPDEFNGRPVTHFYGHESEGAKVASRVGHRLRLGIKDVKRINFIINNHMRLSDNMSQKALRKLVAYCDENGDRGLLLDLLSQRLADTCGMRECGVEGNLILRQKIIEALANYGTLRAVSPLNGGDIIGLSKSLRPNKVITGKDVGALKKFLTEKVVEGELDSGDLVKALKIAEEYIINLV